MWGLALAVTAGFYFILKAFRTATSSQARSR